MKRQCYEVAKLTVLKIILCRKHPVIKPELSHVDGFSAFIQKRKSEFSGKGRRNWRIEEYPNMSVFTRAEALNQHRNPILLANFT